VRRTFAEKLSSSNVFECGQCGERQTSGGWLLIDRGKHACCPSCGSYRVTLRNTPDKIDRMYSSPSNFIYRLFGGALFKCRYCRLQFYDLRKLREQRSELPVNFSYQHSEGERRT
jgi:ribosomal protein L32